MSLLTNLVTDHSFDSTLSDGVGSNTLTGSGSPGYASGLIGNALQLVKASSQYASWASGTFNGFSAGFSLSFWIKPNSTSLSSDWTTALSLGTGTTNYWMILTRNGVNGRPRVTVKISGGTEYTMDFPAVFTAGNWFHVVVTGNGTRQTAYVNGTPVCGLQATEGGANFKPSLLSATQCYLGKSQFADPLFDGLIDQLDWYDHEITPTQVAALYNSGAGLALASMNTTPTEPSGRLSYQLATFEGVAETLIMCESLEGVYWTSYSASFSPSVGTCRDPSLVKDSGNWWIAYTTGSFGASTSFGVAKADNPNLLTAWTTQANVDCSSIVSGGNARVWAPEWVRNSDGTLYLSGGYPVIMFCATQTAGPSAFQLYYVQPTNAGWTTWGAPVAVTGSALLSNMIDPFCVKVGSTFYLWFKNQDTTRLYYLSSSSLASGYNTISGSDPSGMGAVEAASLILIGLTWRLYADRDSARGLKYQDSTTWPSSNTWTNPAGVSADVLTRHGTAVFYTPNYRRRRALILTES